MIVCAPASRAPAIAASPTPPHPNTATESPRPTLPVLIAAPMPAITPQPSSPAVVAGHLGIDLGALAGGDERLLDERPDAERRRQHGAVGERHLLRGVERGEADPRPAAQAAAARAAHRPPVEDDEVAGRHVGDALADRLDDAGGLVAEQEREVVVDAALAVVQVGVAHAARLHLDDRLARPGIGDDDRLDRHRRTLRARHDSANLLCHHDLRISGPRADPDAEITRRAVRDVARDRALTPDGAELTSGPTASMMSSIVGLAMSSSSERRIAARCTGDVPQQPPTIRRRP